MFMINSTTLTSVKLTQSVTHLWKEARSISFLRRAKSLITIMMTTMMITKQINIFLFLPSRLEFVFASIVWCFLFTWHVDCYFWISYRSYFLKEPPASADFPLLHVSTKRIHSKCHDVNKLFSFLILLNSVVMPVLDLSIVVSCGRTKELMTSCLARG